MSRSDATPCALLALDHVQIAVPAGGEAEARTFWVGLLGLVEREKPPALAPRGGCWFVGPPALEVHLGVETPFRPARKAHPAFRVSGLDGLAVRLVAAGVAVEHDALDPARRRLFCADPFGNRLEFAEPLPNAPGAAVRPSGGG